MIAKTRYIRMSPRKLRLVADAIRGKSVVDAETQLQFMRRDAAAPLLKAIRSAAANAADQYDVQRGMLRIARITVDGGPMLKRWRPRAFGRAAPIRSRSAHVTVVLKSENALTRRTAPAAATPEVVAERPAHERTPVHREKEGAQQLDEGVKPAVSDPRRVGKRHDAEQNRPVQKKSKGFLKRLFSRKTG